MNKVALASDDELTQTLARRIQALWDAYRSVDPARYDASLTDDYFAVHPDGSLHFHKPTAQELAAAEVDHYHLTQLRAVRLGEEAALVTYIAEVGIASHLAPVTVKSAVGEVWTKHLGDWKRRYYQATLLK
jgi:Domain of unknown function (DUF4440)